MLSEHFGYLSEDSVGLVFLITGYVKKLGAVGSQS